LELPPHARPPVARSAPRPPRSSRPDPREPLATSCELLLLRLTNHQRANPSLAPSTTDSPTSGLTNCTYVGLSLSPNRIARPAGNRANRWPRILPLSCGLPASIKVVACKSLNRRSNGLVISACPDPVARAVTITRSPRSPACESWPMRLVHGRWPT